MILSTQRMKVLLIGYLILGSLYFFAQEKENTTKSFPHNAFNINLLGDLSLVSLSYERILWADPKVFYTVKVGTGYNNNNRIDLCLISCSGTYLPINYITFPHHISVNTGNGKNFFEVGLGGTLLKSTGSQEYVIYPILGYRLMGHENSNGSLRIYTHIPFSIAAKMEYRYFPIALNLGLLF